MNTLPIHRRWLFWLIVICLFFAFLYAIKAILLPFVVGIAVAYFLDPAADELERYGCSRSVATVIVTLLFFITLALGLTGLIPLLFDQVSGLAKALPGYLHQAQIVVESQINKMTGILPREQLENAKDAASGISDDVINRSLSVVTGVIKSGFAIINLISLIVITPVVSFYLLRDWDRIVAKVDDLLPRQYAETIREQLAIIDRTISGFLRGTVNVMLILGAFYAVSLSLVGLNFAIIIGIIGGVMIIIPYLGTMLSGLAAVGMAYMQFDDMETVGLVLGIFVAGQILEGYVLTPKLVGNKVGLHPLWLIFGMLAGATLFGFVGIFLAVPVTAVIGVLVRFAIQRYRESDYYDTPAAPAKAKPTKSS